MKNKFDWKVVVKTTELHSIDEYLTKWPSIVSKSNKVNCWICNSNGHKMRIQYCNGADESHFHLGVTSRYLLQNIRKSDFFHIDATYKIIKYNFYKKIIKIK